MSDGLRCTIVNYDVSKSFKLDKNGLLIPATELLQMDDATRSVERQLNGNTGLSRRLAEIYMRADVGMANRPLGSTPVISAGVKVFGPSPLKKENYKGSLSTTVKGSEVNQRSAKRERKIDEYVKEAIALHSSLEPKSDPVLKLIWDVEGDQVLTGGGYDNTKIGDVTKSALNFILRGSKAWTIEDSVHSQFVVEESLALRKHLEEFGFREGELKPYGAHLVRFMQDTDGMIGFPIYAKAKSPLSSDIAQRLLIDTGVDVRWMVDSNVKDEMDGTTHAAFVVDAVAYCLDHMTFDCMRQCSLITTLVRIQRHGYKKEDDAYVAKDGKCRSIYPNAAIPGFIEAMTFTPFLEKLKERKVDFMPSLQDKPTRVGMIKSLLNDVWGPKDYVGLAADWTKYDATVKGSILATVIYYAVRPFFDARWQHWVDASMRILCYKYILVSDDLARINNDMLQEALQVCPNTELKGWRIFGLVDGLISGAKFTHGGGSMYGEVVIHRCIARELGFDPQWGPQAGDDTDMGVPRSIVNPASAEETYQPIADAAAIYDLEMNASKQIWQQYDGQIVQVFLQDIYQPNLDIYGIGSAFRYIVAAPFAERDNGLSVAEQELAVLSKLNNGADNPFIRQVVEFWLQRDTFMGVLYKEYGSSAMEIIIQGVGLAPQELRQRLGLGSFEWGATAEQFDAGQLPINPIIAEVAGEMSFPMSIGEALERMSLSSSGSETEDDPLIDEDNEDSIE